MFCWISDTPQGTKQWLSERLCRIPASVVLKICRTENEYLESELLYLFGKKERIFDQESLRRINNGKLNEPIARNLLASIAGIKIKEVGVAVPKWNPYICASSDGICYSLNDEDLDLITEIKSPDFMYPLLMSFKFLKFLNPNLIYPDDIINEDHYAQMQMQMAVLGKNNCCYMVNSVSDNQIHYQIVKFNYEYWNNLYSRINWIIYNILIPMCNRSNMFPVEFWRS